MLKENETMIRVLIPTAKTLKRIGEFGESYEVILRNLIKKAGYGAVLKKVEKEGLP